MYNQDEKKLSRRRMINHTVTCLTTERNTSVCIQREHLSRAWQQILDVFEPEMLKDVFEPEMLKKIKAEIENWKLFHDSQVQTRKPSDLRVCYLCGENPNNDLEIFVQNGVLRQNIWAIEKNSKVIENVLRNVGNSNEMPPHLFMGDLLTFFKDYPGQFDIIYFDACGTLPSAKQKTLKVIGYIFRYDKLTSPGALITNFSFPPEQETTDESHECERDSFEHLTKAFLQFRSWDAVEPQNLSIGYKAYTAKIDSQSIDENYGDYITLQVIDSAYLYIPAQRMLTSSKQSLWDQIFIKKQDFLLNIAEMAHCKHSNVLYNLGVTMAECNKSCIPCKTWVDEIFPDWKSSELKKYNLACLFFTHLLSCDPEFTSLFGNKDVQEMLNKFGICPTKVMWILYGQMAHPSFPVINKSLRLKYTAKKRQMFSDVFIFDKCRYVHEYFPNIFLFHGFKETFNCQGVVSSVLAASLIHITSASNMPSWSCNVANDIPEREVLDFAYFEEKRN